MEIAKPKGGLSESECVVSVNAQDINVHYCRLMNTVYISLTDL